jgi:murein DD-endopeptidase MepM/ murein hydrolase activator NlpD
MPMTIKHFETYDRLTSPFAERVHPITGKKHFHTGIDLVKQHKGEVYATVPGDVIFAACAQTGTGLGGFGDTVCVLDKNKYLHIYAHLDSVVARLDQKVEKGALLGYQGNTGQSAGSHLHYEIRSKSSPSFGWKFHVDPLKYLDKYWAEVEAEEAAKKKDWRQDGLEFLQKNYGVSADWKATDPVDMGTLGIILSRRK